MKGGLGFSRAYFFYETTRRLFVFDDIMVDAFNGPFNGNGQNLQGCGVAQGNGYQIQFSGAVCFLCLEFGSVILFLQIQGSNLSVRLTGPAWATFKLAR